MNVEHTFISPGRDPTQQERESFLRDVSLNKTNASILARWGDLNLPNSWLVAGCLFQTVWNLQSDRPAEAAIKDYDIFYFDSDDLSDMGEQQTQARVSTLLSDLGVIFFFKQKTAYEIEW